MSRWTALLPIVLAAGGIAACGPTPDVGQSECSQAEETLSRHLADSDVLNLVPANASATTKYVVKPCEDDDKVGTVGTNFAFNGTEQDLRDYYKTQLPSHGWTLKGELPVDPASAPVLDVGRSPLCFENPSEPGVILNVTPSAPSSRTPAGEIPASPNFVEFRFDRHGGMSCAEEQRP